MVHALSQWTGRTVLVAGGESLLGIEIAHALIARGAVVVGLVRDRAAAAPFATEIIAKRYRVVHGRCEDTARLQSILAIHEVSSVLSVGQSTRGNHALLLAARICHSSLPVVTALPAFQLRLAGVSEQPQPFHGIARFGELFGPGDRAFDGVFPRTALPILRGEAVSAVDGLPRDFVFARDAALACLATAAGSTCDFTFRCGWVFTDVEMVHIIRESLAGRLAEPQMPVPANPLGWKPSTSLAEATSATLGWYREHLPEIASRRAA